jgi:mono/diheme cytochrome c family protein
MSNAVRSAEFGVRSAKFGVRSARYALPFLMVLALVGCRQDMHDNPRYEPLEASKVFPKGAASRPLVEGTVARGELRADELLYTGKVAGAAATEFPFAISRADLDRGEERYNIYCAPCHAKSGEGTGMVVQRGYRQPPSYHTDRLRQSPPGYFFDVISNGFGVMPDYRAQITVEDRWRIVAYLRVLQASYQGTAADVPAAELQRLQNPEPAAAPAAAAPGGTH